MSTRGPQASGADSASMPLDLTGPPTGSGRPRPPHQTAAAPIDPGAAPTLERCHALTRAARALWILLLVLPAATSASAWHDWDLQPALLLAVSAWWVMGLRLLLPGAAFFAWTFPAVLAGVLCLGADLMRNVALLELAAQWKTFSAPDVQAVLQPYRWPALAALLVLTAWCALCMRGAAPERPLPLHRRLGIVAVVTLLLAWVAPSIAWTRAWPASAMVVAASALAQQPAWASYAIAGAGVNPGRPDDHWQATRVAAAPARETLVLVIGESLRSDGLQACGGPQGLRAVAAGAVVACNVSAGSNATHTSVPLLISRATPGLPVRIPADSSFQKALEHLGFHTAWVGAQSEDVAWPDARERHFGTQSDREVLLPALDHVLAAGHTRLSLVLHMVGAHEPYCSRFDRRTAPFDATACDRLGDAPDEATLPAWRTAYANAADASVGVLNDIIERLSRLPGEVFLVFTPDHGENLLDDARRLYGHAQRQPSRWDIRVPAIFWANDAWRAAHPQEWARLQRHAGQPLMHADMVPTLLQAAGVRVADPRPQRLGLLQPDLGTRTRLVQTAIGTAVPFEQLEADVREPLQPMTVAATARP